MTKNGRRGECTRSHHQQAVRIAIWTEREADDRLTRILVVEHWHDSRYLFFCWFISKRLVFVLAAASIIERMHRFCNIFPKALEDGLLFFFTVAFVWLNFIRYQLLFAR